MDWWDRVLGRKEETPLGKAEEFVESAGEQALSYWDRARNFASSQWDRAKSSIKTMYWGFVGFDDKKIAEVQEEFSDKQKLEVERLALQIQNSHSSGMSKRLSEGLATIIVSEKEEAMQMGFFDKVLLWIKAAVDVWWNGDGVLGELAAGVDADKLSFFDKVNIRISQMKAEEFIEGTVAKIEHYSNAKLPPALREEMIERFTPEVTSKIAEELGVAEYMKIDRPAASGLSSSGKKPVSSVSSDVSVPKPSYVRMGDSYHDNDLFNKTLKTVNPAASSDINWSMGINSALASETVLHQRRKLTLAEQAKLFEILDKKLENNPMALNCNGEGFDAVRKMYVEMKRKLNEVRTDYYEYIQDDRVWKHGRVHLGNLFGGDDRPIEEIPYSEAVSAMLYAEEVSTLKGIVKEAYEGFTDIGGGKYPFAPDAVNPYEWAAEQTGALDRIYLHKMLNENALLDRVLSDDEVEEIIGLAPPAVYMMTAAEERAAYSDPNSIHVMLWKDRIAQEYGAKDYESLGDYLRSEVGYNDKKIEEIISHIEEKSRNWIEEVQERRVYASNSNIGLLFGDGEKGAISSSAFITDAELHNKYRNRAIENIGEKGLDGARVVELELKPEEKAHQERVDNFRRYYTYEEIRINPQLRRLFGDRLKDIDSAEWSRNSYIERLSYEELKDNGIIPERLKVRQEVLEAMTQFTPAELRHMRSNNTLMYDILRQKYGDTSVDNAIDKGLAVAIPSDKEVEEFLADEDRFKREFKIDRYDSGKESEFIMPPWIRRSISEVKDYKSSDGAGERKSEETAVHRVHKGKAEIVASSAASSARLAGVVSIEGNGRYSPKEEAAIPMPF